MFLIFATQYFSVFFLFVRFGNEPEVFRPKYSQTAILHAAHFRRAVNLENPLVTRCHGTEIPVHTELPLKEMHKRQF